MRSKSSGGKKPFFSISVRVRGRCRPPFDSFGVALQVKFVAPEHDIDMELVPQSAQVAVPRPEQAPHIIMIAKANAAF